MKITSKLVHGPALPCSVLSETPPVGHRHCQRRLPSVHLIMYTLVAQDHILTSAQAVNDSRNLKPATCDWIGRTVQGRTET
jgi:hypothetical protein